MEKFTIEITCVTDRNKPVAEINQETDSLEIERYITEKSTFCFKEFQVALNDAKGRLMK